MQIDLKAEVIEPRRHTFSHIAARYGEDAPASRYDEATLDVQATANFHYRPLWQPELEIFDTRRTAIEMADWYAFRDPRQFYYATYNISRAGMNQAADRAFDFVEQRGLVARIDPDWLATVRRSLIPLRHYEWAADLNSLRISDFGYGTRITSAAIFAAADRLGMAQILTRIGLVLDGYATAALDEARQAWLEGDEWQPVRRMVEDSLVVEDWFETLVAQYLAMDGVLHPLVYQTFDDAGLERGGTAVSMMCEFMTDWMADNARWVDAFVQTAVAESDQNVKLLSGWYTAWRDRAADAGRALCTAVLGDDAPVGTIVSALDARATALGLPV
jgi:phenol hydroxylase P1 protein